MALDQQFRASIARSVAARAAALMFAFGMPMSAFGQTPATATTPAAPVTRQSTGPHVPPSIANGTPLSMEDAVKMALENNLGVQAERLNPEIQSWALARATGVYAPTLISNFTRTSSATPPNDFLSSGVAVTTNGNTFSQGGLFQQTKWGGNYQ